MEPQSCVCVFPQVNQAAFLFIRTLFPFLLPVKTIYSSSYTWRSQIVTDVMADETSAKFSSSSCIHCGSVCFFFFLLFCLPGFDSKHTGRQRLK